MALKKRGRSGRRKTRDLILDAAEARVSEHGIAGLTLDALGADVGVTKQAVLYHFKSKEGLVSALVVQRTTAESKVLCAAVAQARDAPDAIERFLLAFVDHYLPDLPGFRLTYLMAQTTPGVVEMVPEFRPKLYAATSAAYDALEAAIQRDPRTPAGLDPRRLAVAVHLAAIGHLCLHGAAEAATDPLRHGVRPLALELARTLALAWTA